MLVWHGVAAVLAVLAQVQADRRTGAARAARDGRRGGDHRGGAGRPVARLKPNIPARSAASPAVTARSSSPAGAGDARQPVELPGPARQQPDRDRGHHASTPAGPGSSSRSGSGASASRRAARRASGLATQLGPHRGEVLVDLGPAGRQVGGAEQRAGPDLLGQEAVLLGVVDQVRAGAPRAANELTSVTCTQRSRSGIVGGVAAHR